MDSMENDNLSFSKNQSVRVADRVDRLLNFLSEYVDLFYWNGKGVLMQVADISADVEQGDEILKRFKQAKEDYSALRAIRSRFYERERGTSSTGAYKITQEQIDLIRNANIGKAFGLSDQKQNEYDELVNNGVEEQIAEFICTYFTSYEKFKQIFLDAFEEGKEKELFSKCKNFHPFWIMDIDMSLSNGVRTSDRGYIEFLKDVMGYDYIVYDGTNLAEKIEAFLKGENDEKGALALTGSEKEVICRFYGMNSDKQSSKEIAECLGVSNSRIRQILTNAMNKIKSKRMQLNDFIYIFDKEQIKNFFITYYQRNDIVPIEQENIEFLGKHIEGLTSEDYCKAYSINLKTRIEEIERLRDVVSSLMKHRIKSLMTNLNAMRRKDSTLRNLRLSRCNLTNSIVDGFHNIGIYTIGEVIEFSRKCDFPIKDCIDKMGYKTYDKFKQYLSQFGLVLEDMDKSEKTRAKNEEVLDSYYIKDATEIGLYIELIRCEIHRGFLSEQDTAELEEMAQNLKECFSISISKEDMFVIIRDRIRAIGRKVDRDFSIEYLSLPGEAKRILNSHGIEEIRDLYKLRARDMAYLYRKYGTYIDMVDAELIRLGLVLPEKANNTMRKPSYFNEYNIDLIKFLIDEGKFTRNEKEKLYQELYQTIECVRAGQKKNDKINYIFSKKIDELEASYRTISERQAELAKLYAAFRDSKSDSNDEQDVGDI